MTGKPEFRIIDTPKQRGKHDGFSPTRILSQNITPVASTRNLGVTFDNNFNFRQHISQMCRCCLYHIRDLRRIRRYMSLSVVKTIVTALVSSRLDYCNSLLHNIAIKDITKFQRVQNYLAKGSYTISSFLSLSATSKIIALAPCAISHYFQYLYNYLSSPFIQTTCLFTFNAHSSKTAQAASVVWF